MQEGGRGDTLGRPSNERDCFRMVPQIDQSILLKTQRNEEDRRMWNEAKEMEEEEIETFNLLFGTASFSLGFSGISGLLCSPHSPRPSPLIAIYLHHHLDVTSGGVSARLHSEGEGMQKQTRRETNGLRSLCPHSHRPQGRLRIPLSQRRTNCKEYIL